MRSTSARLPSVGVIGAGRVGSVLAARLRSARYPLVGVTARSEASHRRARTLLPGLDVVPVEDAARAEVLVLAVPDDDLIRFSEELAATGAVAPGTLVVHTSGRHGLDALAALTRLGARPVALHPAMTFTGTPVDLERTCVFGLTAGPGERADAARLVEALGGTALWVDEDDRVLYHAALAHGANHLVTLVSQSMELLREASAGADVADVLRPLLTAALDNALTLGDAALTGPVARGDVTTVRAHTDALAHVPGSTRDTYVALARATALRAEADGRLDAGTSREVRQVLREAEWDALAESAARV